MESAPAPPVEHPEADRASRAFNALLAARKALQLYPPSNPQVLATLDRARGALVGATASGGPLVVEIERERFCVAGSPIASREGDLSRLAFKLHCLNVRELAIEPGLERDELVAFLGLLNQPYEALSSAGPLHETFAGRGITRITVHYAEAVVPGRSDQEAAATGGVPLDPIRRFRQLAVLLQDPSQYARELVRLCVQVVPRPGERKLDAQLAFVDRYLQTTGAAIEAEPAESRPDLYANLAAAVDALVRSADPSGAKMGGLPHVDLAHIDPKVLQVLPQRDLVKEVSSKVKLHQGATTVMASALRSMTLQAPATSNPVLDVIEGGRDVAKSVATNIQVLDEIRVGQDVDGEYPGIAYAERDKNKNFNLGSSRLPGEITADERRTVQTMVDEMEDWRPGIDVIETELDMLFNEGNPNFLRFIGGRLVEKLGEFLDHGEIEPALRILRGLSVERRQRRDDADSLAVIEKAIQEIEGRPMLERVLRLGETLPVESQGFDAVQALLFLLDKRVIHTIIELVSEDETRYSRKRLLLLAQYLCRNRIDLLVEGLRSPRPEVARTFVWLLGHFGRDALPHLRRAAHHPEPRVRREVARGLAGIDGDDTARTIASLIGDRDDGVAAAALRAAAARPSREALGAIEAALGEERFIDRPEELALLFVRTALRIGGPTTLPALRRAEDSGKLRWMLKTTPLRDALRGAVRELEERLRSAGNRQTGPMGPATAP